MEVKAFFVVIRGPLGVGKTSISREVAKAYKARYIAIDEILESHKLEVWDGAYISENSFLKANEIACKEAREYLDNENPVIFDGNFYYREVITDLQCRLNGYDGIVITLSVPLEECIRRDSSRKTVLGEEGARLVYEKSTEFKFGKGVDATGNFEVTLTPTFRIIEEFLEKR